MDGDAQCHRPDLKGGGVRVRLYSQGIVVNHHSGMAGLNFERARAELESMRLY